jgi:hypothetical protein
MAEHDLALVRLVAGRFRELQGFRRVLDAVSLLMLWTLLQIPPVQWRSGPYLLASLAWAALTLWSAGRVARWYREWFGSTPGDGSRWDESAAGRADAGYRVLLIWTALLLGGAVGAVLPLLTIYAARVTWRDWPYRPYWLLLVIEGAVFSLAFYSLGSAAELRQWERHFVWSAAPVLAVVGLLDHRLLARTLRLSEGLHHADTV